MSASTLTWTESGAEKFRAYMEKQVENGWSRFDDLLSRLGPALPVGTIVVVLGVSAFIFFSGGNLPAYMFYFIWTIPLMVALCAGFAVLTLVCAHFRGPMWVTSSIDDFLGKYKLPEMGRQHLRETMIELRKGPWPLSDFAIKYLNYRPKDLASGQMPECMLVMRETILFDERATPAPRRVVLVLNGYGDRVDPASVPL